MSESPPKPVILDASTLLNLYAGGRLRDIAETLPEQFVVAGYVARREALYIRRKGPDRDAEQKEPVDIAPFTSAGLIHLVEMSSEEQETFVDLAAELDDGEAITASLAVHRGYVVATDDLKALKVISATTKVDTVSTLSLVKRWSESANISREQVKVVLQQMWSGASYRPGTRDPLYAWWLKMISV